MGVIDYPARVEELKGYLNGDECWGENIFMI